MLADVVRASQILAVIIAAKSYPQLLLKQALAILFFTKHLLARGLQLYSRHGSGLATI